MKKIIKGMILSVALLAATLLLFSCAEATQYEINDSDGYTVSVKFDANGGMFTTNVSVITDSYQLSELPVNPNGQKEIALLAPNDEQRGKANAYTATNAGYFLAGWYTQRNEVRNQAGDALDADGNVASESGKPVAYTYAGRWDFGKDVKVLDPNGTYSSSEPVVTLYAAWIPEFKFEFYHLDNGQRISDFPFDPNYLFEIECPSWNEETGKLDMKNFPSVSGKTWTGVYLDADGTMPIETATVVHTGTYDEATASAKDPVMKLYLDFMDGEWYRISTVEQFLSNVKPSACYDILADLDFEGQTWPTSYMHGIFSGRINGNGHIFKNITVAPTDARKLNNGMFGSLASGTHISDIRFENVTLDIAVGTISQDVSFGLFAGKIDANAVVENITFTAATVKINAKASIMDTTSIGRFCGVGNVGDVDISNITAILYGEGSDKLTLEIDGNEVQIKK